MEKKMEFVEFTRPQLLNILIMYNLVVFIIVGDTDMKALF